MKKLGILILWLSLLQIGKAQLNIAYDWYDYEEVSNFVGGTVVNDSIWVYRNQVIKVKDTLSGDSVGRSFLSLEKLSLQGEVLDTTFFKETSIDSGYLQAFSSEMNHVQLVDDTVLVFLGELISESTLKTRGKLIGFNSSGKLLFRKEILPKGKLFMNKFIASKKGGLLIHSRDYRVQKEYCNVQKFTAGGEKKWELRFKPEATKFWNVAEVRGLGVYECANGDILVSGFWEAGHPDGSGFLARINQQGVVWEKELDAPNEVWEKVFESLELPNGNIVLCEAEHYGHDKVGTYQHARIRIYDANGELIKSHTIPDAISLNSKNFYKHLLLLKNGDFIAVGKSSDKAPDQQFNQYLTKVLVSRYTASGEHLWSKRYHHPEFAHSYCDMFVQAVLEDPHNDSIMLLGHLLDISTGHRKPWFMKMDKDGLLIPEPDAVEEITPLTISLYPNPNSGNFMLRSHVVTQETYRILNLQGQVLHEGKLIPFEQKAMQLHLPAGVYIFSTTTHKQTFTVE